MEAIIINENEGKNVVSYSTVTRWFAKFRVDDEKLEDKPRAGRPSKLDKDALRRKIEDDPHITIRELEELLNCGKSTIDDHLKAMGMVKKLDKWVPHNLTDLQKAKRRCASEKLLQRCKNEEFLDRIVTIDEKWTSFNNTRRSTSWCKRGEAPKPVPKPELHEKKLMVTVWWCSSGVIQYDFMKPGQSITADTYCAQIDKLRHNLPTMVRRRGPIILQDNARPHAAKKTVAKFRELGYEVLERPPYSPDLAPTDFHLFKHLSSFLNGRIFKTPDDAKNAFKNFINSRNPEFYNRGIKKLVNRWQDCIDSDAPNVLSHQPSSPSSSSTSAEEAEERRFTLVRRSASWNAQRRTVRLAHDPLPSPLGTPIDGIGSFGSQSPKDNSQQIRTSLEPLSSDEFRHDDDDSIYHTVQKTLFENYHSVAYLIIISTYLIAFAEYLYLRLMAFVHPDDIGYYPSCQKHINETIVRTEFHYVSATIVFLVIGAFQVSCFFLLTISGRWLTVRRTLKRFISMEEKLRNEVVFSIKRVMYHTVFPTFLVYTCGSAVIINAIFYMVGMRDPIESTVSQVVIYLFDACVLLYFLAFPIVCLVYHPQIRCCLKARNVRASRAASESLPNHATAHLVGFKKASEDINDPTHLQVIIAPIQTSV
ncbi:unnamed protein product [Bursaphelenchus okinawaensis]|uniref:HTH_48 domain-containing protein n=1 Tax=Bursaphelenchus okinawaensis TaxID=465554 RepID=A0A811K635_9BILA|nr:unnamed protein product [Bursaphelenchus okinawaensis]CAG9092252.1 unnamed protein product [Bursaphelenchus okinawaensis]